MTCHRSCRECTVYAQIGEDGVMGAMARTVQDRRWTGATHSKTADRRQLGFRRVKRTRLQATTEDQT
jgi:hypothetical protein